MSFLENDDPFSKFLFIILLLIGFIVVMNLSMKLITALLYTNNPILVKGMVPGNVPIVIQQDPSISGSIPVE